MVGRASRSPVIFLYTLAFGISACGALGAAQCATLTDYGTHITTDVELGTPGQWFAMIVDTGSNALTVPGCECVTVGFCDKDSRCFEGNLSSSFAVQPGPYGVPPSIKMVFGSGPIFASVSSELVQVGGIPANMQDSLYLINGHALHIETKFEGILGLGLPFTYQLQNSRDSKHQIFLSRDAHSIPTPPDVLGFQGMQVTSHASLIQRARGVHSQVVVDSSEKNLSAVEIHGFAEKAGVQRMAICLKNQAPGVMNFQPAPAALVHGSVGRVHWGLDFRGISVGNVSLPVEFCTDQEVVGNKTTPCGAMVDTGSTSLRAPGRHIAALYAQICDIWPRCAANFTTVMAQGETDDMMKNPQMAKGFVFKELLLDCKAWWVQGVGLDELPKLYFHIRGAGGTSQSLELHGWSYVVIETVSPDDAEGQDASSAPQSECVPAFRPIEYETDQNGPVWVLGMPLFYEYQVGFDYASWPPGLSFDDTECSPCQAPASAPAEVPAAAPGGAPAVDPAAVPQPGNATEPSAVSVAQSWNQTYQGHGNQRQSESQLFSVSSSSRRATILGGRRPRRVPGKFRESHIDITMPL